MNETAYYVRRQHVMSNYCILIGVRIWRSFNLSAEQGGGGKQLITASNCPQCFRDVLSILPGYQMAPPERVYHHSVIQYAWRRNGDSKIEKLKLCKKSTKKSIHFCSHANRDDVMAATPSYEILLPNGENRNTVLSKRKCKMEGVGHFKRS